MILPFDVPVDPDADEARELLVTELAKPQYQAARPTLFDQLARAFWDWLNSLTIGGVQGPPALGLTVVLVLVAAAIVVALLVFGLPRLNRRSAATGGLFGEDDTRDASTLRRHAEAAAAAGDWSTAVEEMFRAIARGLAERTILSTTPGTTATQFAARAAAALPALTQDFTASARAFDEVRYLGHPGTPEHYATVAALEARARASAPPREMVDA